MKNLLLLLCLAPLITNAQVITTIAGTGSPTYSGDVGPATAAQLNRSCSIAVVGSERQSQQDIYIADFSNNVIRKISASGIISTVAGNGTAGYSGDGGPATAAQMNGPNKIIVDTAGNLYVPENYNHVIRKISTSGIITTIAGTGVAGFGGDGGPATLAKFNNPTGIALDDTGNLLIADYHNNRIRKVNGAGIISTIAGTGAMGSSGDGGPAISAEIYWPIDINLGLSGTLFVSEINSIRKINTAGTITTFAGASGLGGYNGDGIPAVTATVYNPFSVVVDIAGNVYIADQSNNRVRKIDTYGIISTIAGTGVMGFSGDGGAPTLAKLNIPSGLFIDNSGVIYIADQHNSRVRKISQCIPLVYTQPSPDTVIVGTTAIFTVSTSAPGISYQWQQNTGSGFINLTNVLPYNGVNTNTLTINNVTSIFNNTQYRCVFSASFACPDTSTSVALIIHGGVGVNQLSPGSVSIFPNPAYDKITIQIPGLKNGDVMFINELGQVVMKMTIDDKSGTIDIEKLPAGFYILRIEADGQILNKKIFKN